MDEDVDESQVLLESAAGRSLAKHVNEPDAVAGAVAGTAVVVDVSVDAVAGVVAGTAAVVDVSVDAMVGVGAGVKAGVSAKAKDAMEAEVEAKLVVGVNAEATLDVKD